MPTVTSSPTPSHPFSSMVSTVHVREHWPLQLNPGLKEACLPRGQRSLLLLWNTAQSSCFVENHATWSHMWKCASCQGNGKGLLWTSLVQGPLKNEGATSLKTEAPPWALLEWEMRSARSPLGHSGRCFLRELPETTLTPWRGLLRRQGKHKCRHDRQVTLFSFFFIK